MLEQVLHFGFSNLANARMKNVIYNLFDIVCFPKTQTPNPKC